MPSFLRYALALLGLFACSSAAATPIPVDPSGINFADHLRYDIPVLVDLPTGPGVEVRLHLDLDGLEGSETLNVRPFNEIGGIQIGLEPRRIVGGINVPGSPLLGPLDSVDLFFDSVSSIDQIDFHDGFSIEFYLDAGAANLTGLTVTGVALRGTLFETTVEPAAVPEPTTLSLLGLGLAGLAARQRRRTPTAPSRH